MTSAFDSVHALLRRLPGLGTRSAERLALHLLVENPERADELADLLQQARQQISRCEACGNISEEELCAICSDESRARGTLCIVESVLDLVAAERSGVFRGRYHVLHGKLSPLRNIGPENLNLASLPQRLQVEQIEEIVLALPNDIEGEATCHYLQDVYLTDNPTLKVSRIGFGLPSGGGLMFADPATLRSALEGRRNFS